MAVSAVQPVKADAPISAAVLVADLGLEQHARQRGAAGKGKVADRLQAVRQLNIRQAQAAGEGLRLNGGEARRERDRRQPLTVAERARLDGLHQVENFISRALVRRGQHLPTVLGDEAAVVGLEIPAALDGLKGHEVDAAGQHILGDATDVKPEGNVRDDGPVAVPAVGRGGASAGEGERCAVASQFGAHITGREGRRHEREHQAQHKQDAQKFLSHTISPFFNKVGMKKNTIPTPEMASLFAQLFAYCTGFFCAMQDRRSQMGAPVL